MSNYINHLKPNQIFVFGSNKDGIHAGGAAKQAFLDFGAIYGIGFGLQGQSYAIPTMEISLEKIGHYITKFIEYARLTPDKEYLVTAIGTGIAGFRPEDIDPYWINLPANVIRV